MHFYVTSITNGQRQSPYSMIP